MATDRHWHGEYSHAHEGGDRPHEHVSEDEENNLNELSAEIQEDIDRAESESVSESIDESMNEDIDTALIEADDADVEIALRKESNDLAAKALRKDAKARQEAIDATRTAVAASQPGVPVEVALSAEKKFSDALRHKSQAQETANLAMQIQEAIDDELPIDMGYSENDQPPVGGTIELEPAFPEPEEPEEIEPETTPPPPVRNRGGMRIGRRNYGR